MFWVWFAIIMLACAVLCLFVFFWGQAHENNAVMARLDSIEKELGWQKRRNMREIHLRRDAEMSYEEALKCKAL